MNDDKLLEKIKQSADSCEIPESLKPENIEERLDTQKKSGGYRRRIYQISGVAAAVLVVLFVAVGVPALVGNKAAVTDSIVSDMAETDVRTEGSTTADQTKTLEDSDLGVKDLGTVYKQAEDYDAVYEAMESQSSGRFSLDSDDATMGLAEDSVDSSSAKSESADMATEAVAMDGGNLTDYSTTNLQVEGVDEGDIVKTDGNYLYIIHENRMIRIVKIDGADMKEITEIQLEAEQSEESIQEIYLTGSTLNIICQGYTNGLEQKDEETYYMSYRPITSVYTYDLSKPEEPKMTGKVSQDGNYNTSRKVDGYLYLFTGFYPNIAYAAERGTEERNPNEMIPFVNDKLLAPSDIYLPCNPYNSGYMVISSINMKKPGEIVDKKAIMENASQFYISTENIYIQSYNWNYNGENTNIAKFHFEKGKITGESAALVRGTITDTFAINEYDGYLRVLTTAWNNGMMSDKQLNYVFVLDDKMDIVGRLEGLAEGESIYSARFMGDLGYFVTYRQVDPLFSVDFSNPKKPKILGELKVSGFSEYLHFYGENQLLGIGWETNPDTGERKGLKLSMFDISDPKKVTEVGKTVIKNIDYFPGEYDYKALTVNPDKNIIGFLTTTYGNQDTGYSYMVFSYDKDKGFQNKMAYTFRSADYSGWGNDNARGIYVNDTFYVVSGNEILVFDMNDGYKKIGELIR